MTSRWWRMTALVAEREVRQRGRSRAFAVSTVVLLLVVAAAVAIPAIVAHHSKPQRVGIVGAPVAALTEIVREAGHLTGTDVTVVPEPSLAAAEAVVSELGDGRLTAQTRYWTGQACLALGDLDGARAAFESVAEVFSDEEDIGHAYAAHGLGDLARCTGDYDAAASYLAAAMSLAQAGADAVLEGRVWLSRAALYGAQGDPAEQEAALIKAQEVFAGTGLVYLEVRALAALAQVKASQDDPAADDLWARIESLYDAAGLPDGDRRHRRYT